MNPQNYEVFAVPEGEPSVNNNNTYTFTLPPSSTGFYVALQDIGSCIALSRLRVYHNNCKSFQTGLVEYPDAPAPVSGSATVNLVCEENAEPSSTTEATCQSDGTWTSENLMCNCQPGYKAMADKCIGMYEFQLPSFYYLFLCLIACPQGEYRSREDTNCKECPVNTKTSGTAATECECYNSSYYRNTENRVTDPGAQIYISTPNDQPSTGCTRKF